MNILTSLKQQSFLLIALTLSVAVIAITTSPFSYPIYVPILVVLLASISFISMVMLRNKLKISVNIATLVHLNIIVAVIVALCSLHQLKITDMALIIGLYFLLRIYSKR
ncbi:hypothetical protein KBF61_00240 [Candidatus Saccharibacteria bacterium]|jgi:hypothetical protein|nr:hypothetical protein [Candidatus Saccharibacteria bacterium]